MHVYVCHAELDIKGFMLYLLYMYILYVHDE